MTDRTPDLPQRLLEELISGIVLDVAELPDRDSPEGWPDAMIVTDGELRVIVTDRVEAYARAAAQSLTESEAQRDQAIKARDHYDDERRQSYQDMCGRKGRAEQAEAHLTEARAALETRSENNIQIGAKLGKRVTLPETGVLEICWRQPHGAVAFWQIHNHPHLGSRGLNKQGHDFIDELLLTLEDTEAQLTAVRGESERRFQTWVELRAEHDQLSAQLRSQDEVIATLRALVVTWRVDTFHSTMGIGWKVCANALEAALGQPDADREARRAGQKEDEPVNNEIPRRIDMQRWNEAEKAIHAAVQAVEAMPADVRLTDAVVLLGAARESVADYQDGVSPKRRYVREQLAYEPIPALASSQARDAERPTELFRILKPYVGHRSDCTYGQTNPDGDFCSCGLRAAKDAANAVLRASVSPTPVKNASTAPEAVVDALADFIDRHRSDIQHGINDFGDLRGVLAWVDERPVANG